MAWNHQPQADGRQAAVSAEICRRYIPRVAFETYPAVQADWVVAMAGFRTAAGPHGPAALLFDWARSGICGKIFA